MLPFRCASVICLFIHVNKILQFKYKYTLNACIPYKKFTNFPYSINIKWRNLKEHLALFQRKIEPIAGDGYCLMKSVLKCLDVDYGEKITFEQSKELVLDEIYSDVTRYAGFHTGNNREVLKQSEMYFENGLDTYNKDITDVIVCAAANALEMNFAVFQDIGGNAVIIYTNCNKVITPKTVFLKLDDYPGDSSRNYYSAIVIDDKAAKEAKEHKCTESPVKEVHSNANTEVLQHAAEASDYGHESDNSGHSSFQFPVQDLPTPKKRGKTRKTRGRNHLDMTSFQNVPVEVMDEMPWDIDGNRIITVSLCQR